MQAIPSLVGTSCAVAAASSGLVFGQAIPEQDRAHTSYINRPASVIGWPRSSTPGLRPTRPFSQDCEPAHSRFSRLFVPEEDPQSFSTSRPFVQEHYRPGSTSPIPGNLSHHRASSQSLKHSSSTRQIQHQSSTISSATIATSTPKTTRPVSRRYTLSKQLSFRRNLQHQPPQEQQEKPLPTSRSHTPGIDEDCSTSVSSHGSWIRRLSRRPVSQHGSPRSSSALDTSYTSSVTQSPTPSAKCGSTRQSASTTITPTGSPRSRNKLVKRSPSITKDSEAPSSRRRALSQLSTFRRPATSHQRSATLQSLTSPVLAENPTFVLDQSHATKATALPPLSRFRPRVQKRWSSFFHAHIVMVNLRSGSNRFAESKSIPGRRLTAVTRRMYVGESAANSPACLLKSDQLDSRSMEASPFSFPNPEVSITTLERLEPEDKREHPEQVQTPPRPSTSSKVPRRSLSMTLSSTGNWISKTGSLRRFKRSHDVIPADSVDGDAIDSEGFIGQRNSHYAAVNTPLDTIEASVLYDNTVVEHDQAAPPEDDMVLHYQENITSDRTNEQDSTMHGSTFSCSTRLSGRQRNISLPLPSTAAVASIEEHAKLGNISQSPNPSVAETSQPPGSRLTASRASSGQSQDTSSGRARSSTIGSSDMDGGDSASRADDTDFRSDVAFDSLRTQSSMPNRTVETPFESVFNDSPPGTTLGFRQKRPSILPDPAWDAPSFLRNKDEENLPTPVGIKPRLEVVTDEYNPRLSMTDDFDDDWGDFDTSLAHGLSPPSVQGSMNMNSLPPSMRQALAGLGRNMNTLERTMDEQIDRIPERPLSNLFDWTESSIHIDGDVDDSRPRTVHGKQDMDSRGGRPSNRRAPLPAHIRSQSVPVVNECGDNAEHAANPKFGTWGLGSKTASEDWGEDFEFGDEPTAIDANTGDSELRSSFLMLVPPSIQASQPSLRAHSGQIRELSLLVNDLKRLCRHGKELNLTTGTHHELWEEAEGIIALASPDEDELESGVEASQLPSDSASELSNRFFDDSLDEREISHLQDLDCFDGASRENVLAAHSFARRPSVLSPDDDIFGRSSSVSSSSPRVVSISSDWPLCGDETVISEFPQTPTSTQPRPPPKHINGAVRSVAAAVHHSTLSNNGRGNDGKFHFDTTSLKTLVKQAGDLRDRLANVLHQHDPFAQSPVRKPAVRASPAFTQVFNDPATSPSRLHNRPRAPSTLSITSTVPPDPTPPSPVVRAMGRRMQLMSLQ
ncbi:hypothetical protein BROUX41_003494 [Berkeleyomyces rouxiae]